MIESLDIQFGASTPGLGGQVREVIGSIRSVGDAMDAVRGFAEGLAQGIREALNPNSGNLKNDLNEAAGAANHLGDEMDRVDKKARDADDTIGKMSGSVKGLIAGFVAGIGTDQIMSWIDANASAAERLGNLSQRLNVSATAINGWQTIVEAAGGSAEGFAGAMTKLEMNTAKAANGGKEQAAALRQLGIAATEARDPNEMLLQIADKFSTMDDGPKKVALAMTLMGRAGAEQIPILNMGREAIEQQIETATRYGAVMDESMIAKAQAVDAAMDESSMAMKGLSNTIFSAVAPSVAYLSTSFNTMVAAMVESYRTGGVMKTIFDIIGDAIKVLISVVAALGWAVYATFEGINSACWALDGVIKTVFASIQASINVLVATFQMLGQTIMDVFSLNWDNIAGNVKAGLNKVADAVRQGQASIQAAGQSSFGAAENAMNRAGSAYSSTDGFVKGLWNPPAPPPAPPKPKGSGDFDLDLGTGKGDKSGGVSQVQKWAEELNQQKMLSGEYFRDQNASDLAFWQEKLALTTQGSKNWYEIQDKIFTASKALAQQQYQEQISSLDFQIQSQRDNYSKMSDLEAQKVELVRRTYGETSSQYQTALREQERMAQQHEQEMAAIAQRGVQQRAQIAQTAAQTDLTIEQNHLREMTEVLNYNSNAGLVSLRQAAAQRATLAELEFQARAASEERIYQITAQSLREQLQIQGLKAPALAAINTEIEKQEAAHNQRMQVLDSQHSLQMRRAAIEGAEAVRQTWTSRLQPVTQALTRMVNGFLTGTQTMRGAVLQMGSQLLQAANTWILQWVQAHVTGEVAKTSATVAGDAARTASTVGAAAAGMAATTTTATAQITTNAAVGASGALASISSIPVIGPYIAPAIAAGIMALAMGFISKIASAEGGWGQVPYDGAMTELHKDEMVLPASIASPLRDALSSKDSTWGLGQTGMAARMIPEEALRRDGPTEINRREGDQHFHISALDTKSGVQWLMKNRRSIGHALGQSYREGNR